MSSKFGCRPEEAAKLLKRVKASGAAPCLTFHVGSQCLSPFSYAQAIEIAQRTVNQSGVAIAALDVGGGFPTSYAGQEAPPYHWYFDMIKEALANFNLPDLPVMCEPGRALVGQGISLLAQVLMRRGDRLYINDGIYGSFDEQRFASFDENYPPSVISLDAKGKARLLGGEKRPFRVYGPTCDPPMCCPVRKCCPMRWRRMITFCSTPWAPIPFPRAQASMAFIQTLGQSWNKFHLSRIARHARVRRKCSPGAFANPLHEPWWTINPRLSIARGNPQKSSKTNR